MNDFKRSTIPMSCKGYLENLADTWLEEKKVRNKKSKSGRAIGTSWNRKTIFAITAASGGEGGGGQCNLQTQTPTSFTAWLQEVKSTWWTRGSMWMKNTTKLTNITLDWQGRHIGLTPINIDRGKELNIKYKTDEYIVREWINSTLRIFVFPHFSSRDSCILNLDLEISRFSTASPLLFPLPDIIVLVVYRSGFSFEGVGVVGLSERGVLGAWGCLHSFVHVPRDLFFYSLFLGGRTWASPMPIL